MYLNRAVKELLNDGLLMMKPSTGAPHVSINPKKLVEAEALIGV
ncbi:MAG: hypothetical protein ABH854_04800 [Candidatus Diapherotrites archaeon]